jgi:cobalamin biosynthesis Co2+ chelatase CbiK
MSVKKLLYMLRFGPTLGSGLANECVGRDVSHFRKQFERLALDRPVFLFTDSAKPLCTHRADLDPTLVCDVMMLLSSSRHRQYLSI